IIGFGLAKKLKAITPPISIPTTKNIFQISFFQSYLKKEMLAGRQAAQAWRRLALMPKFLFPKINNAGTVSPTSGPAMYQGQGCFKNSNIYFYIFSLINLSNWFMATLFRIEFSACC